MKKILEVLYQSDDNYAPISSISITSLLQNNKHLDSIRVFYCGYRLTSSSKKKLTQTVKKYPNASIDFIEVEGYHQKFRELGVKTWHGVYVTWLKMLAMADLPAKTDRVLYLDPHTIVNSALDYIIELDFNNNVLALAYDGLANGHKATIGLKPDDGYYNCGVMLFNHKKWLKENINEEVISHLQAKNDYDIADQDLCNVLFRDRIKLLDVAFNFSSAFYAYDLKLFLKYNDLKPAYFYSYEEIMGNYYAPKIIHSRYGLTGKPWEKGNEHPNKYLWKKYMDMTPWKDHDWPAAKKTLNWRLKQLLPKHVLMFLYSYAVNKKYSKVKRVK